MRSRWWIRNTYAIANVTYFFCISVEFRKFNKSSLKILLEYYSYARWSAIRRRKRNVRNVVHKFRASIHENRERFQLGNAVEWKQTRIRNDIYAKRGNLFRYAFDKLNTNSRIVEKSWGGKKKKKKIKG